MATTEKNQHWLDVIFPTGVNFGDDKEGVIVPSGQSADRPAIPVNGTIRYNTTLFILEAYVNGTWENLIEDASTSSFIGLTDTPATYPIGQQILRSNVGQTGLEFIDGNSLWLPLLGGTMGAGASVQFSGGTIKNVPSPNAAGDVANKDYVDGIAAGLAVKESVHAATTGPIDLGTQGLAGIDGHAPFTAGDRILVKDQTDPTENGVYAAQVTAWNRTTDMDGTPANEVQGGTTVFIQDGTVNGNTNWTVVWDGSVTVDIDPMNWTLISTGTAQDLWQTISTDGGSQIALTPTDTLTLAGGTGISTAMSGGTVTITNDSPNVDQNLYQTFVSDSGTTPAPGSPTTSLNVLGAGTVSTAVVGNTLTITGTGGGSIDNLVDGDSDTSVTVEVSANDEDVIRFNTGDTPAGFGVIANTMRLSSGQFTVNLGTALTTIGAPITLNAGSGGLGGTGNYNGGSVSINAGASSGSGVGGVININSGAGNISGAGGGINMTAGTGGANANGGGVLIEGGYAGVVTGGGGAVIINGGDNEDNNQGAGGGSIILTSGLGKTGNLGGKIDIQGGTPYASAKGSNITITGGVGNDVDGGDIILVGGQKSFGSVNGKKGGAVRITGGVGTYGSGGDVFITGGAGTNNYGPGGDVVITPGDAPGNTVGSVKIAGATSSLTAELRFQESTGSGTRFIGLSSPTTLTTTTSYILPATDGATGFVLTTDGSGVMSWSATALTSSITDINGDTRIRVEVSPNEDKIRFDTGNNIGNFGALADAMVLSSAEFTVDLGTATTSAGAPISLTAGGGDTTKGGDLTLAGGAGAGVDGGDVIIAPGNSTTAQGGSIVLNPGDGATAGAVTVPGPTSALSTEMRFQEASANGAFYIGFRAPVNITGGAGSSTSFIWPGSDGVSGQPLTTNGSGSLVFSGPRLFSGTGSPEGVLTAPVGSMYTDSAGGVGTTLYIKETGTGNTGWAAK